MTKLVCIKCKCEHGATNKLHIKKEVTIKGEFRSDFDCATLVFVNKETRKSVKSKKIKRLFKFEENDNICNTCVKEFIKEGCLKVKKSTCHHSWDAVMYPFVCDCCHGYTEKYNKRKEDVSINKTKQGFNLRPNDYDQFGDLYFWNLGQSHPMWLQHNNFLCDTCFVKFRDQNKIINDIDELYNRTKVYNMTSNQVDELVGYYKYNLLKIKSDGKQLSDLIKNGELSSEDKWYHGLLGYNKETKEHYDKLKPEHVIQRYKEEYIKVQKLSRDLIGQYNTYKRNTVLCKVIREEITADVGLAEIRSL